MALSPLFLLVRKTRKKSAFSLIEAAIVLALVGIVIGGIWVAAASVNRAHRLAQFKTGVLEIVSRVRANYANTDFTALDASETAYALQGDPTLFTNIDGFTYVGTWDIRDPWGVIMQMTLVTSGGDAVNMTYYDVSQQNCMQIYGYFWSNVERFRQYPPWQYVSDGRSMPTVADDCPSNANNVNLYFYK